MPHRQVSKTHAIMMLTDSRERANPASRAMNPACMKNTRKAAISTQTVLSGLTRSLASWAVCASPDAPAAFSNSMPKPFMAPRIVRIPSSLPPRIRPKTRRVSCWRNFRSLSRMVGTVRERHYVAISETLRLHVCFLTES
jgi:hypothetical protein